MFTRFLKWYAAALWWVVIILVPLWTIILVLSPVYDWLNPWDEAVAALKQEGAQGLRLMIGGGSNSESHNLEVQQHFRQRSFVMLPSVLWNPTVYEYVQGTGMPHRLNIAPYAALVYLLGFAAMIGFSWFVSIRKLRSLFGVSLWSEKCP